MVRGKTLKVLVTGLLVVVATLAWTVFADARAPARPTEIWGGGTTMVRGGTGAPTFVPVITKFTLFWRQGSGGFECLALAPSAPAGKPGSANFDTDVMYVTGHISSAEVRGRTATLRGSATVTGIGAGLNKPFTAVVTRGGPGATLVLTVSGITFREILVEGAIRF